MVRIRLLVPFVVGVLMAGAARAYAQDLPPADTAWRYRAGTDLEFFRVCPASELLIATKKSLVAVDAAAGTTLWELGDLPNLGAGLYWGDCDAKTGLSYRQNTLVAFDLVSGRRLWDAAALPPFQEIRGYLVLSQSDILLLLLRTAASDRALAAFRLSTGERLWQRDDALAQMPKFSSRGGVSDIGEYQVVYTVGDTSLLVYLSPDGPMRLNARTGATEWVAGGLGGRRVPAVGDYAAMRLVDSVLVIPFEKGLTALDVRSGHVLWEISDVLPRHASRLVVVPSGLVVRAGRDFLSVLDPLSGAPRWQPPFRAPTDGTAYAILGDRYLVMTGGRLLALDLATGDTTGLADLRFEGGENAELMLASSDRIMVASRQNLFTFERDGTLRYHRYYKAPGANFLELVSGMQNFGTRMGSAEFRSQYAYFVTNAPDSTGRSGNSLVRVALDDGREAGRIWFRERSPSFEPDPAHDQLIVVEGKRTLVALRFPGSGPGPR